MTRQPDEPWTDVSSPETAAAVAAYLVEHPTSSIKAIAAALGIGRSTALRAVHRLRNEGAVHVDRLGTGDGYPTRYTPPAAQPDAAPAPTSRKKTRRGRRAKKRPADGDGTP